MSLKRTLIKGTFLLTVAGMISRLIGFYYRIFLTHTIGAEGIGIYQLIFPVYALCFSLTSAGIQTTVSRLVAANDTPHRRNTQFVIFRIGLALSISLALLSSVFIYTQADWISIHFIQEKRCSSLLRILACTIPLGSLHCMVSGYYLGIKNASLSSVTQLVEQIVRVVSVYTMVTVLTQKHQLVTFDVAVWGMVFGEGASALISLTAIKCRQGKMRLQMRQNSFLQKAPETLTKSQEPSKRQLLSLIIRQSAPLTANRLVINSLQSVEAILIPAMLRQHGLGTSQALSTYGVLTGMALPLVMFPSAITNSVSVMLLPAIAQAQAEQKTASIKNAVENALKYCLLLGIYCTGIFLYLGNDMGMILFHNEEAGKFIVTLAWICPFLYITTTLGSIVHGLGKTFTYFVYNCLSLCIRIGFVTIAIPQIGILGYLWGVLASQLLLTALLLFCLNKECRCHLQLAEQIVVPVAFIGISILICNLLKPIWCTLSMPVVALGMKGIIVSLVYCGLALYNGILKSSRH